MARRRDRLAFGTPRERRLPGRKALLFLGGLALLSLLVLRLAFYELVSVRGYTMGPNVLDGDVLLVAKRAPAVGDVALVEVEGERVLRRVIAGPGQQVSTVDGVLVVDGRPLPNRVAGDFTYRVEEVDTPRRQQRVVEVCAGGRYAVLGDHVGVARPWVLEIPEIEVPPDHLFVLCDNRRLCPLDERAGVVPTVAVEGVATQLLWFGEARVPPPAERPLYGAFVPLGAMGSASSGGTAAPEK